MIIIINSVYLSESIVMSKENFTASGNGHQRDYVLWGIVLLALGSSGAFFWFTHRSRQQERTENQTKLTLLTTEKQAIQQELDKANRVNQDLQQEMKPQKEKIEQSENLIKKNKTKISELKKTLKDGEYQLKDVQARVKVLETQILESQKENGALKSQHGDHLQIITSLEKNIKVLEEIIEQLKVQNNELRQKLLVTTPQDVKIPPHPLSQSQDSKENIFHAPLGRTASEGSSTISGYPGLFNPKPTSRPSKKSLPDCYKFQLPKMTSEHKKEWLKEKNNCLLNDKYKLFVALSNARWAALYDMVFYSQKNPDSKDAKEIIKALLQDCTETLQYTFQKIKANNTSPSMGELLKTIEGCLEYSDKLNQEEKNTHLMVYQALASKAYLTEDKELEGYFKSLVSRENVSPRV